MDTATTTSHLIVTEAEFSKLLAAAEPALFSSATTAFLFSTLQKAQHGFPHPTASNLSL